MNVTPIRPVWGVYLVLKNGAHRYVERSATTSEKLAREIADDLSHGLIIKPDGSRSWVRPRPHIAKEIER
jgi:hypothetical protein